MRRYNRSAFRSTDDGVQLRSLTPLEMAGFRNGRHVGTRVDAFARLAAEAFRKNEKRSKRLSLKPSELCDVRFA